MGDYDDLLLLVPISIIPVMALDYMTSVRKILAFLFSLTLFFLNASAFKN